MVCIWHLRAHRYDDEGELVLSLDMEKHMHELPEQQDIIDELLLQPEPLPPPPPKSPEGSAENAFGNRVQTYGPVARPRTPVAKVALRMHHTFITDCLIFKYVDVHGPRWRSLARSLGGRATGYSDDVVRNRYIRIMAARGTPYEPQLKRRGPARKPITPAKSWTAEEDSVIQSELNRVGSRWTLVQQPFGDSRTLQAVRNRANRLGLVQKILEGQGPVEHKQPDCTHETHSTNTMQQPPSK